MHVSAIDVSKNLYFSQKKEVNTNFSTNPLQQENGAMLTGGLNKLARINALGVNNLGSFTRLSFTGNPAKNLNQFAFLAPENKAIGLNSMYALGGLGVVTKEAGDSWAKEGADVRQFHPYHSFDNEDGLIKVLSKDESGNQVFKSVETSYSLKEGENFVVLQAPNNGKSDYRIIEDINVQGSVKTINNNLELEETPYKLFKMAGTGEPGKPAVYFIHTKDAAKFQAAYGVGSNASGAYGAYGGAYGGSGAYGGAYGSGGSFDDLSYSKASKAFIDALPKLDKPEHGNFNPGNLWLHDRQAFHALVDVAEKSSSGVDYYNGITSHATFHNPGRNYQGHYDNPIDFFRMVGSEADLKDLKNSPHYGFVKAMADKIQKEGKGFYASLTPEEATQISTIFEPVIGKFKDSFGSYNLCEIPIQAVKVNPKNSSAGTVSANYGKEMKNPDMPEIAEGLTKDLASIETKDIVNGSTPANMKTNEIGDFGRPGNGFNAPEIKNGFTPFEVKLNAAGDDVLNLEEIYEAKQKNTKWLTNTIAKATREGKEALNNLFFNGEQINPKSKNVPSANVLGGLSEYKEGDIVHISWGRPDPQKGLPTLLESFLHFIKREDVTKEEKLRVKLLVGAGGPNPWEPDAADWKKIQSLMKEIAEVDGGTYKNNACYVNGFFPNRLANACIGSIFTSTYEPCGITPLESYAAGNPVISIRTGGAPDFIRPMLAGKEITNETGFLTKHAYLVKPEVLGGSSELFGDALNDFRRKSLAAEVSDCMKEFSEVAKDKKQFMQMMKNVLLEKTDWPENDAYNGGKSANGLYFNKVFKVNEERSYEPLQNLKGKFTDAVAAVKQQVADGANSAASAVKKGFLGVKSNNVLFAGAAIAIAGGAYVLSKKFKGSESNANQAPTQAPVAEKTQPTVVAQAPVTPVVSSVPAPAEAPKPQVVTQSLIQQFQQKQEGKQLVKQA